jgi:hypothetical protein
VLNRLQSYLVPRMGTLDMTALVLAGHRGEADYAELKAMTDRCSLKCGGPPDDKWSACTKSCWDNDLIARVRACTTPTWLPF